MGCLSGLPPAPGSRSRTPTPNRAPRPRGARQHRRQQQAHRHGAPEYPRAAPGADPHPGACTEPATTAGPQPRHKNRAWMRARSAAAPEVPWLPHPLPCEVAPEARQVHAVPRLAWCQHRGRNESATAPHIQPRGRPRAIGWPRPPPARCCPGWAASVVSVLPGPLIRVIDVASSFIDPGSAPAPARPVQKVAAIAVTRLDRA